MSLPTYATFYNKNVVVGVGLCNAGWFITPTGLYRCFKDAMDSSWSYYSPTTKKWDTIHNSRFANYFTKPEDLKYFDNIKLYEMNFPREIAMKIYLNQLSIEEFEQYCREVEYFK